SFTLRWWEKVLVPCFSHITFRLYRLVAQVPSPDLLISAKDLFMGAKQVERAMLTPSGQHDWSFWTGRGSPWLTCQTWAEGSPVPCRCSQTEASVLCSLLGGRS